MLQRRLVISSNALHVVRAKLRDGKIRNLAFSGENYERWGAGQKVLSISNNRGNNWWMLMNYSFSFAPRAQFKSCAHRSFHCWPFPIYILITGNRSPLDSGELIRSFFPSLLNLIIACAIFPFIFRREKNNNNNKNRANFCTKKKIPTLNAIPVFKIPIGRTCILTCQSEIFINNVESVIACIPFVYERWSTNIVVQYWTYVAFVIRLNCNPPICSMLY